MTELEKHRKTWQGKTDEWLFNRLANELKDKVEEIHKLLAENEQLILSGVSQQRELLKAYAELIQSSYTHHFFDDAVEESIDKFLSL